MEDLQTNDSSHGHPLLQGRRKSAPYTHGFSKPIMKSLAALCDTFIPAVSPEKSDPEAESFYLLSGSQNEIPDQVAEAMSGRVKPIGLKVGKVILWLLSTRLGTWILCGSASMKPQFPFLQNFSEIPQPKREQILLDWSRGKKSGLLRFAFKLFKICCLFTFYSVADKNGENPAWKAIGYCPPKLSAHHLPKPLDKGVIDLTSAGEDLASPFKGTGFIVTEEKNQRGKTRNWRVECDVVVVGSGSGGGVAAGVLARAGYRVVVVEKGKYFARDDLTLLEGPSLEKMYESGGLVTTNDGKIIIMAGATVGGGSAINWSASIRTPQHVLEEWAKQCDLPFFATQDYQNAMDAVCERLGVQERCEKEGFQNSVLRKGCSKLGLGIENVPRNSTGDHFCGSCCFGCPSGEKKGADETWLADAVEAGALILAGCRAEKVICIPDGTVGKKKKRAVGVVATVGVNGQLFIQARVTVAAAGSVLTPPLLRSSGLRNRNIGKNLHLHPVQMAWGYFPEDREPVGKPYEGGIITAMCKDPANGTINQTPALAPGSFAAMIPWTSGLDMKQRMRNYSRTAHIFALLRDRSGGSVMDYMDIDYRISQPEKEKLREGLRRAVRILVAAGAKEVGTHRSDGQRIAADGATAGEMEAFFTDVDPAKRSRSLWTTTCSAHQMGSCRMGRDETAGAVDWKGQTWEVEGLFVCDGSLLPTALGVNPMITIQSVVYYVSQHILQFLSKTSGSDRVYLTRS